MDQESNEVKLTDKEHTDFQGTSKLMKFSPCDEEAEILQGSTVELCVCHKSGDTCHKKRLVLNKEEGKLEVTETLNGNHKRIEAHFYTQEEMLIRTIRRVNDHHQHVHVDNNDELKILKRSKQYAKQHIHKYNHSVHNSLHDDYYTYLFEVER